MDFTDTRLGAFLGLGASSISADLFLLTEFLVKADISLSAQNCVGGRTRCFWHVGRVGRGGRGIVGNSWRCSVICIKCKISKTPIEYTLGFLDWFVGSLKTVRDANADVVLGAFRPSLASQIEQYQG